MKKKQTKKNNKKVTRKTAPSCCISIKTTSTVKFRVNITVE